MMASIRSPPSRRVKKTLPKRSLEETPTQAQLEAMATEGKEEEEEEEEGEEKLSGLQGNTTLLENSKNCRRSENLLPAHDVLYEYNIS